MKKTELETLKHLRHVIVPTTGQSGVCELHQFVFTLKLFQFMYLKTKQFFVVTGVTVHVVKSL